MAVKKPNAQDATLINIRALKKSVRQLEVEMKVVMATLLAQASVRTKAKRR